jgi:hypothetical protein
MIGRIGLDLLRLKVRRKEGGRGRGLGGVGVLGIRIDMI